MQNLAKPSGRLQPSHARKIDSRLRVTSSAQYSAILSAQRKYVTGLREVFGRGFWIGDRQDRGRPIVRADSGSYSARCVHRNSKVSAMHFAILRHHSLQAELLRALVRNGRANQAAPMRSHE